MIDNYDSFTYNLVQYLGELGQDVKVVRNDELSVHEIERLRTFSTTIVAPRDVAHELTGDVTAIEPGGSVEAGGLKVQAVPAYNTAEERLDMHPKSNGWVGYVFEFGGRSFYHAGDTDALPELERLDPDVAVVPVGGTYTMGWEEADGVMWRISARSRSIR